MSNVLDKDMCEKMYSDAYKRTMKFIKEHPEHSQDLNDLCVKLMKACVL